MKKILFLILSVILIGCGTTTEDTSYDFTTRYEKSQGTETPTYPEVITFYQKLADQYPSIQLEAIGMTDSGHPLHLVTFDPDQNFNFETLHQKKNVLLINNGIHPGESDGIDATMLLMRDLAQGHVTSPKNTIITAIPIYNIGGALNRNSTTRTNQNGPKSYGFRGNARNYDLNRDFIKNDTKNAQAFAKVFHHVQPDVFIDNHVSNGADYQYTLTHLFTQHNKLHHQLGQYLKNELQPQLENHLSEKQWDITPYVNVWGTTPDKGFSQFLDTPRYSTGYTTLWNTLGMMVETHMLKPYKKRVDGTYELMKSMIEIIEKDASKIKQLRSSALASFTKEKTYPILWKVDTTRYSKFDFKGFNGDYIPSEITGANRLKYYRDQPYQKTIKYKDYFKATKNISIPEAYIIPQGWWPVIERLQLNKVEMHQLQKDSTIQVESYRIADYKTRNTPFEGHYLHYNTNVSANNENIHFSKGDWVVPTNQSAFRYVLETLEPEATDSFFNWNFFDTILQQKEGFSPYVWEDKALAILKTDANLKMSFEQKKTQDSSFASNWYAQLDWIHKHSAHYEKAHLQYPIYRILRR
ncbi:M14 family metallopeptidase [Aquimarina rhabdastrellae]